MNLRQCPKEQWLRIAEEKGMSCEVREGKTMYVGAISFKEPGFDRPLRQVFQVIERSIDRDGQLLLIPELEVNVYWTSLGCAPWGVIENQ